MKMTKRMKVATSILSILVFAVMFLIYFHIKFLKVEGDSMYPTLRSGEYIVTTDLLPAKPGDVVIAHFLSMDHREFFVKRLIATGNQNVGIKNGIIYINSEPKEFGPRVPWKYNRSFELGGKFLTIPNGLNFVMGDNRDHSTDSRQIGLATIAGKVILTFPHKWW